MTTARSTRPRTALVLADVPEHARLRELRASLESRRDRIADMDLEIEGVREQLATFEQTYHARLAAEHHELQRVASLTRYLERWADVLERRRRAATASPSGIERDRAREVERLGRERRRAQAQAADPGVDCDDERRGRPRAEPVRDPDDPDAGGAMRADHEAERRIVLRSAFRALARRFHPDLARTEEERLHHSGVMARINELYRLGDVERLEAMAEQARGGEIEDDSLSVDEQTAILEERLAWFEAVLENLAQERRDLEASATCEMMRNVEQAAANGTDLIEELRVELRDRIDTAYRDVRCSVQLLEKNVATYNRTAVRDLSAPSGGDALEARFDPFADKRLVRLGLEQLAQGRLTRAARELADWVEQSAHERPALVRLLLFTHVSELSPYPLQGLESYDDVSLRFDALGADAPEPLPLERALVEADDLVELGVRRASEHVVRMGLRFRSDDVRVAVSTALQRFTVRRLFGEVLAVLGERATCPGCAGDVFAVPLYRLRGLDDLRANVCPACGHTLSSYWMPKGKDVQAVLNDTFLDFDLVSEWSFRLARSSVAMQLVPVQVEALTVGDLKGLLVQDVFARHDIEVGRAQVHLRQGRRRVAERTPLAELDSRAFRVRFTEDAPTGEAEALELVRHRIRNRFR